MYCTGIINTPQYDKIIRLDVRISRNNPIRAKPDSLALILTLSYSQTLTLVATDDLSHLVDNRNHLNPCNNKEYMSADFRSLI